MENKKIILVVEDDLALQEAFKLKLGKDENIEVRTAISGEEALAIMQKEIPDLVTLDILLPKINGIDVLLTMRSDARLKHVPVIVVSVSGGSNIIKKAFDLGVKDFLIKSDYGINEMITKIKGFLS